MKKLIILMMLLFSVSIFAEKLTTDGKNNLDKLKGSWESLFAEIIYKNNKWYIETYSSGDNVTSIDQIKIYKKGVLIVPNFYENPNLKDKNLYFAYDTKYKTLVEVDKDLNIIEKHERIAQCLRNKTCN